MREAHGYWGFQPDRIDGRMLVAEGLAAEMGFELPVRNRVSTVVISMTYVGQVLVVLRYLIDHQRHWCAHRVPRQVRSEVNRRCFKHPGIFAADP